MKPFEQGKVVVGRKGKPVVAFRYKANGTRNEQGRIGGTLNKTRLLRHIAAVETAGNDSSFPRQKLAELQEALEGRFANPLERQIEAASRRPVDRRGVKQSKTADS